MHEALEQQLRRREDAKLGQEIDRHFAKGRSSNYLRFSYKRTLPPLRMREMRYDLKGRIAAGLELPDLPNDMG